jgi:hypothetical protein
MNRRDFLRLGTRGKERVLELSCERLHMRWVDARVTATTAAGGGARDDVAVWEGEPPLDVAVPTADQLLTELDEGLAGVRVLRVAGLEWLAETDFGREVQDRLDAFRRRGGRVE